MSRDDTLAFWVVASGRGELRREALPAPTGPQVSVQALYSGVSRGTEALVFNGLVPVSEYQRMRAPFQAGEFPFPVKYGYASVGRVLEGPAELCGKGVFCLYPHQQRYVVDCDAVYPLPEAVPPERAVLAANMESALNAVWDTRAAPGDRIAVIGGGSLGCLAAWLLGQIPGCEVELIDVNPQRREIADTFGIGFATPDSARGEADVVVHASGSPQGLALALRVAGFEATVCELSWYGPPVTLPLGEAFHSRRLTLKSSQVGNVAPFQRARWSRRRRMQLALRLLADPRLEVLINSEGTLERLPETMALLCSDPADVIMHRVNYARG